MGRRCQCEKLLEMLETDWRLRIVGRETAMVWLELVRFIHRFGDDLVLRMDTQLGSSVGSYAELAFALRIEETQLATHLETLVGRHLLARTQCGGITMPPELGLTARQKAARLNGAKGGRPRKDAQPVSPPPVIQPTVRPSAQPSAQRSLLLPLPSSPFKKIMETQIETQRETQKAPTPVFDTTTTTTTASFDSIESKSASGSETPSASLATELAKLAGHRKPPHTRDQSVVNAWLEAGATRDLLQEVFQSVLAREKCPLSPALSYFDGAVRDALSLKSDTGAAPIQAEPTAVEDIELRKRLVNVSTMRGRHSSAPLAPTWSAFKASAARDEESFTASVAWLEVMEQWERNAFRGHTPPGFAAFLTTRINHQAGWSNQEKQALG